jgi:hypothetical protein
VWLAIKARSPHSSAATSVRAVYRAQGGGGEEVGARRGRRTGRPSPARAMPHKPHRESEHDQA